MPAKFVTIGDSLTQGFKNGAITDTHLSYPNLIAQAIGDGEFGKFLPDFSGEGGLPFNIERLLRLLQETLGDHPDLLQTLTSLPGIRKNLDDVEDYWERGPGTKASHTGPLHRNLAVWGFRLLDALLCTELSAQQWLEEHPPLDNLFKQIPQESQRRTIRRTLNPSFGDAFSALNQVRLATKIKQENGGLENLIL